MKKLNNASFLRRLAAFVIDVIILGFIITVPFRSALRNYFGEIYDKGFFEMVNFISTNTKASSLLLVITIVSFIISLFYWTLLEWKLNQSIGGMLFHIKVISVEKKLLIKQLIIRNISKALVFTDFIFLLILDTIYMFFNKDRQRFVEKISKTKVIQE